MKKKGFSLLEVLIALAILSIGLLGVAGLQGGSLLALYDADLNFQAFILAQDMVGRMTANPIEIQKGFNSAYEKGPIASQSEFDQCMNTPNAFWYNCAPDKLAQSDIRAWQASIRNLLPNGQGIVCIDADAANTNKPITSCDKTNANPKVFAIKIAWRNRLGIPRRLVVTFGT